jgi:hypothetical protein
VSSKGSYVQNGGKRTGESFVPPLPTDIDDLKRHITEAVAAVTCDML